MPGPRDHLRPPPPPAPETDQERRARQLAITRELTDLNMRAARDAAHRIPHHDPADGTDPTLDLARATRAVTQVLGLENRIASGEHTPAPALDDHRGQTLRKLLYPLVAGEPDAARRRALERRLGADIDDSLGIDFDESIAIADLAANIARRHGLKLDLAKVPDQYLVPFNHPPGAPILPAAPRPSLVFTRPDPDERDRR